MIPSLEQLLFWPTHGRSRGIPERPAHSVFVRDARRLKQGRRPGPGANDGGGYKTGLHGPASSTEGFGGLQLIVVSSQDESAATASAGIKACNVDSTNVSIMPKAKRKPKPTTYRSIRRRLILALRSTAYHAVARLSPRVAKLARISDSTALLRSAVCLRLCSTEVLTTCWCRLCR